MYVLRISILLISNVFTIYDFENVPIEWYCFSSFHSLLFVLYVTVLHINLFLIIKHENEILQVRWLNCSVYIKTLICVFKLFPISMLKEFNFDTNGLLCDYCILEVSERFGGMSRYSMISILFKIKFKFAYQIIYEIVMPTQKLQSMAF